MIICQLRLAVIFAGSLIGIFEIDWKFVFISIATLIISVLLGYKKEEWD
ncbi:MAG: hypothetical protein ACTSUK_06885 [Promethearchaeota archaeon]